MVIIKAIGDLITPNLNWPYQNRWGHWVWKSDIMHPNNRNWPGIKPPAKFPNAFPIRSKEDNEWYWAINEEEK